MKRGFTLVELSIVLVIIGLIIGGILVAQSMISAQKIISQVRQFQQFDIAVTNFKTTYKSLPGDNDTFEFLNSASTPVGVFGNNNGVIEDGPCCANSWNPRNEFVNFWAQLSRTEMLNDRIIYSTAAGPTIGVSMPKAIVNGKDGTKALTAGVIAYGFLATGKNYYSITGTGSMTGRSLNAQIALALDTKMDDSNAGSGIFTIRTNATALNNSASGLGNNCADATGKYRLAPNYINAECSILLEMLSQTGD